MQNQEIKKALVNRIASLRSRIRQLEMEISSCMDNISDLSGELMSLREEEDDCGSSKKKEG